MAELNYNAVVEQWMVTLSELLQAVTKSKKPGRKSELSTHFYVQTW